MAAEQTDFIQILNSLLSVDNALRSSAEVSDLLNQIKCVQYNVKFMKNRINDDQLSASKNSCAIQDEKKKCPQCAVN